MSNKHFLTFEQKKRIYEALENNKDIQQLVIDEIDRLEQIIKDYDIVLSQAKDRFEKVNKPS